MSPSCSLVADSAFGPAVDATCRSFDFTLLFEQTVLGLVPAVLFALWFALRLVTLARASTKTLRSRETWLKVVSIPISGVAF